MRITAIILEGCAGWPNVAFAAVAGGLNVVYGPQRSGKSTIASLLAHLILGKSPVTIPVLGQRVAPPGEVIVESNGRRYRVRRYHDAGEQVRLTIASLDGTTVDPDTVAKLVRGLPPSQLSQVCAVSFRDALDVRGLLSKDFIMRWQSAFAVHKPGAGRRVDELVARRDVLAQELETRIAGERRASKELETRSRDIGRMLRDAQDNAAAFENRLKSVESSLAETDARLRYRRLELNAELRWQPVVPAHEPSHLEELDEQVARWRQVIGEMAKREADVRARLGEIQTVRVTSAAAAAEQRAWLAMARQLAADLSGEVARLARATGSAECVCRDAHPRLRPIAETIERQLNSLESLVDSQHSSLEAAELVAEVDHLAGSQEQLRRHVDHLLDRRQAMGRDIKTLAQTDSGAESCFSAADAAQLERRRTELEQERFDVLEKLRSQVRLVHDLTAQREALERQRAALLSARSMAHVHRELSAVQQKLELAAAGVHPSDSAVQFDDVLGAASEFLAKLTNGDLIRLVRDDKDAVFATTRAGEDASLEMLNETQRDQVYLSACLALLTAASRHGLWLPLVLDEPFEHLDERAIAAMAAVLDGFSRQGHQVIVFSCDRSAAERLASLGASAHDILSLRGHTSETAALHSASENASSLKAATENQRTTKRRKSRQRTLGTRQTQSDRDETSLNDKSDAA
jgi:energy-coupling factor transporter ATP-binding protein EcfA2